MKRGVTLALVTVFVVLLLIGMALYNERQQGKRVAEDIQKLYDLWYGNQVLVGFAKEGGFYRADFELPEGRSRTWISEDGSLLYSSARDGSIQLKDPRDLQETLSQVLKEKEFATCLDSYGVLVFLGDEQDSDVQSRALGRFAGKLFINCATQEIVCDQVGINHTPSVLYKQTIYPGLKDSRWFDNVMGCKLL